MFQERRVFFSLGMPETYTADLFKVPMKKGVKKKKSVPLDIDVAGLLSC